MSKEPINSKSMMFCASENLFWAYLEENHVQAFISAGPLVFADTDTMYKGPIYLSENDIHQRRRYVLGEAEVYSQLGKNSLKEFIDI